MENIGVRLWLLQGDLPWVSTFQWEGLVELGDQPDFSGSRPQPTLCLAQVVLRPLAGPRPVTHGPGNGAHLRAQSSRQVAVRIPIS